MTAVLLAKSTAQFTLHPSPHQGVTEIHVHDMPLLRLNPRAYHQRVGEYLERTLPHLVIFWGDVLVKGDGTIFFEAVDRVYMESDED